MTTNERTIMRNERVNQLTISLSQKAMICEAIHKKYGSEGISVIQDTIRQDIIQWVQEVLKEHKSVGKSNNLDGLHEFLWEVNLDENMEFECVTEANKQTYRVIKCPIAEFAVSKGIAQYGKLFFCDNYELIASTYNPKINFERKCNMMDGDKMCVLSYKLQE